MKQRWQLLYTKSGTESRVMSREQRGMSALFAGAAMSSRFSGSGSASGREVFAQGPPRISGSEAAAALQFRHQKIDDVVQHLDLLGLRVA